jgi:hypothetical protein
MYLRDISWHAINKIVGEKIIYPSQHPLMQRTLSVCPLGSRKEGIETNSLALAYEDVLASAFGAWLQ